MITAEGKRMIMQTVQQAKRLGLCDDAHVDRFKAASSAAASAPASEEPYSMTSKDVCAYLGVEPWTLDGWRKHGKLRYRKIGRRTIRYRKSDVIACIEANHVENVPDSWRHAESEDGSDDE